MIKMATTKAKHVYTDEFFGPDDYIMFGKDSVGMLLAFFHKMKNCM